MEHLSYITLSGFIVAAISVVGIILVTVNERLAHAIEKNLKTLSALSAGIFLVTSYLLVRETLEIIPFYNALSAFLIGITLYLLLHKVLIPHRHHGTSHEHQHQHEKRSAWKMLIGDSLHNVADGLVLVTSFGAGVNVGVTTSLSIALHEVPQEIAEFFVLRKSGYTNREAIYRNLATALSIFVGIGLGVLLLNTESIQGYLLGATATFFLGIVFTDLFPVKEVVKAPEAKQMFASLVLGLIIMGGISNVFGNSHEHEDHEPLHEEDYGDVHEEEFHDH